jgi:type IV pilus assembly protein PilM
VPKPIRTPYCVISLPESQVFTTIFKLPSGLKRDEIKNTIPFKAEEVIPFKTSEIYFDFKPIAQEGETQEVFYVAVPIKVVDSYLAVLEGIGLNPLAFDLESISLARAVVDSNKKSAGAKLIMDIGDRTTNLNIFSHGGIRQSVSINVAGDRFTKAISSKLKVTPQKANELKMKSGFNPKQEQGKVLLVLQNEFKRIIEEAKKLIDYFQTEQQGQIDKVILAGGSSLLPAIDQYLADNFNIETTVGKPFTKISDPNDLAKLKGKSVLFSNVTGLALRGISKDPVSSDINLLPSSKMKFALAPPKEEKKAWKSIYIRLAIFVILVVIFGGLLFAQKQGQDFYRKLFPQPTFQANFENINFDSLDQLRQQFIDSEEEEIDEEETEAIEPEIKVQIINTGTGFLNVREGPGTNNPKIGQALPGEEYLFIAEEDDWYQIELDQETVGWVSSNFAELIEPELIEDESTEDGEVQEEAEEVVEPEPVPKISIIINDTSLGYLNVREGPGTGNAKIGEVLPDEEFAVLDESQGWYQIEFEEGTKGWISSVYVDKVE